MFSFDTPDRQCLLGDSLLVAPVFSEDGIVTYYLPEGRWTDYFSGRVIDGPRWVRDSRDFMSVPLWVRPNSILPIGNEEGRPDYDYSDGITLRVYELEDGQTAAVTVPTLTGEPQLSVEGRREGTRLDVRSTGSSDAWRLLLIGIEAVESVDGGATEKADLGTLVTPPPGAEVITITLVQTTL